MIISISCEYSLINVSRVGNIIDYISHAKKEIQLRQASNFYKVDPEYESRVAEGLGLDLEQVKAHAK